MPNLPIISILHPTARVKPGGSFPRGFWAAHDQFRETCSNPSSVEYLLVVHESRWEEFWAVNALQLPSGFSSADREGVRFAGAYGWHSFEVVLNTGRDCVVDQINAGAEESSGQLLIGIMDDLEAPERWDEKLLHLLDCTTHEVFNPDWRNSERVIDLTGEPTEHIVYGALTRARYEKQGFILHPDFESMYADNYFSEMAHRDGVVISGRGLGFKHRHFFTGGTELDAVYQTQNDPGKYFRGRNAYARLTGRPVQKSIAVCLPGEWFQSEWVAMWTELFGHLTQNLQMMTLQFFGYTSNVYCTRMTLAGGVFDSPIEADYVLWLDDDNKLSPEQFNRLLLTLEEHPELAGVTGWCYCDNHQAEANTLDAWVMSCGRQDGQMKGFRFTPEDIRSLGPVITSDDIARRYGSDMGFWSGFPCVLMRGAALRELGAKAFAPIMKAEAQFGFTGEDTAFFWNARLAGQKWAVDASEWKIPHIRVAGYHAGGLCKTDGNELNL